MKYGDGLIPQQQLLRRSERLRRGVRGTQGIVMHGSNITKTRHQYSFTLGTKQPPAPLRRSRKKLQYSKRLQKRKEVFSAYSIAEMNWEVPSVEEFLSSPIAKFIGFSMTILGYEGTVKDLVCTWVHPLMLQAIAVASKEDNPN